MTVRVRHHRRIRGDPRSLLSHGGGAGKLHGQRAGSDDCRASASCWTAHSGRVRRGVPQIQGPGRRGGAVEPATLSVGTSHRSAQRDYGSGIRSSQSSRVRPMSPVLTTIDKATAIFDSHHNDVRTDDSWRPTRGWGQTRARSTMLWRPKALERTERSANCFLQISSFDNNLRRVPSISGVALLTKREEIRLSGTIAAPSDVWRSAAYATEKTAAPAHVSMSHVTVATDQALFSNVHGNISAGERDVTLLGGDTWATGHARNSLFLDCGPIGASGHQHSTNYIVLRHDGTLHMLCPCHNTDKTIRERTISPHVGLWPFHPLIGIRDCIVVSWNWTTIGNVRSRSMMFFFFFCHVGHWRRCMDDARTRKWWWARCCYKKSKS